MAARSAGRVRDLGVVRYERDAAIARIVLNAPDRANAQSSEMVTQVDTCLDEARRDYDVKVVIVKGAGNGFCAGHVMAGDPYPEFVESQTHFGSNYLGGKELFLWPTRHGYAIGGGTYWALLPEITVASDDAQRLRAQMRSQGRSPRSQAADSD